MIGVCFVVDYYEVPFMNNGTKKMQGLSSPASVFRQHGILHQFYKFIHYIV